MLIEAREIAAAQLDTEVVMKIKAMGVSILMAESRLGAASRIGDRLYAIDRGEIIFHGSPKDARRREGGEGFAQSCVKLPAFFACRACARADLASRPLLDQARRPPPFLRIP